MLEWAAVKPISDDDVILELARRGETVLPRLVAPHQLGHGLFEKLMHPVIVDIAIAVFRDEVDDTFAKRMGLSQEQLNLIVAAMRDPTC